MPKAVSFAEAIEIAEHARQTAIATGNDGLATDLEETSSRIV